MKVLNLFCVADDIVMTVGDVFRIVFRLIGSLPNKLSNEVVFTENLVTHLS